MKNYIFLLPALCLASANIPEAELNEVMAHIGKKVGAAHKEFSKQ